MVRPDFKRHVNSTDAALAEREEGRSELLVRLLRLSDKELIECGPEVWGKLKPEQLAELLARRVSPGATPRCWIPEKSPPRQASSMSWRDKHAAALHAFSFQVSRLPRPLQGLIFGGIAAAIALGIATPAVSLSEALLARLPDPAFSSYGTDFSRPCKRLTAETADCVYIVQRGLSWADVASLTGIDESTLRDVNPHLANYPTELPSGADILLWRPKSN